jgi:vacuolar-type H+-ATPase subunit I/STV1
MITQKIQQIFHDRETDMVAEIWDTIQEDKFKVYKVMREEYSDAFAELNQERKKIDKKKKSKKEKIKAFKNNTR